jgi:hypothetical protein
VKLSEIATRLARPLVCAVFGHERWPVDADRPLWALRSGLVTSQDSRVELELCRRCGTLYAARWEWRRDYAAEHVQAEGIHSVPKSPEAA